MESYFETVTVVTGPLKLDPEKIEAAVARAVQSTAPADDLCVDRDSTDELRELASAFVAAWNDDSRERITRSLHWDNLGYIVFAGDYDLPGPASTIFRDAVLLDMLPAFDVQRAEGAATVEYTYRFGYPGTWEDPGEEDEVDVEEATWEDGGRPFTREQYLAISDAGHHAGWWTPPEREIDPPDDYDYDCNYDYEPPSELGWY